MTQPLPPLVAEAAKGNSALEGGLDGATGLCWLLTRNSLSLWQLGADQRVYQQQLPYALKGGHHVSVLTYSQDGTVTVLLATSQGNIFLWPNFIAQDSAPITERIQGPITALTAAAQAPAEFVAVVATADGHLHQLRGSNSPDSAALAVSRMDAGSQAQQAVTVLRTFPSQAGQQAVQLLALCGDKLEQWQVSAQQSTLLWSAHLPSILQGPLVSSRTTFTDLAIKPPPHGVYNQQQQAVLLSVSADQPPPSKPHVQLHRLAVSDQPKLLSSTSLPELHQSTANLARLQCCCSRSPAEEAVLLWGPEGRALQAWSDKTGFRSQNLDAACLGADSTADGTSWDILTSAGVQHLPIGLQGQASAAQQTWQTPGQPSSRPLQVCPSQDVQPALSTEALQTVYSTLDAAVAGGGMADLANRLERAGAFKGDGAANAITAYSKRLVDTLPKHWGGAASSAAITDQLAQKRLLHNSLLHTLAQSGSLARLAPATLRAVLANAEKLAAVEAIRETEDRALGSRGGLAGDALPMQAAVKWAGEQCKPKVAGPQEQRTPWEVFFSCPSTASRAFFAAIATQAPQLAQGSRAAKAVLDDLLDLAKVATNALNAAVAQRAWHEQQVANEAARAVSGADEPQWDADLEVRSALQALVEALLRITDAVVSEAPDRLHEFALLLLDLTERLLNSFAAAQWVLEIRQVGPLSEQYAAVRDHALQALLQLAVAVCDQGDPFGESMLQRVESLAEAHRGYSQLFDVCAYLEDAERLYGHMAALTGATAGTGFHQSAADYVFERLYSDGRKAQLLELPDEFNGQLLEWLSQRGYEGPFLELRWLHELRMQHYPEAAQTLLHMSQHEQKSIAAAQRTACLSKLAAAASQPSDLRGVAPHTQAHLQRANGRLALLEVQELLALSNQPPMGARALAEAAMAEAQQPDAAVLVFDILAAAGQDFRAENRPLFEAAWRRLVAATDWNQVSQDRASMPDDAFRHHLATMPVAAGAQRCYCQQPEDRALCVDGELAAVFPPEQTLELLKSIATQSCAHSSGDLVFAFEQGCLGYHGSEMAGGVAEVDAMIV